MPCIVIAEYNIGRGEHLIFFFLCPVCGSGGGDCAGGGINTEIVPQRRQVVAIPKHNGRLFSVHHVLIQSAKLCIRIGNALAVIVQQVAFLLRKRIGGKINIPFGGVKFIQIQPMVFHGNALNENAFFMRLLQLIHDFLHKAFICQEGTAVEMLLCV